MNNITIVGNVGQDPELRYLPSGQSSLTFSLATSRKVKEEWQTTWHKVVVWGEMGENCAASIAKGNRVMVIGRIDVREWQTKAGEKRTTVEIVADEVAASFKKATAVITRTVSDVAASNHDVF